MRLIRISIALVTLAVIAAPAYADGFVTPFIGYNFGGDSVNCMSLTDCEEKHLNLGVSFGSMGHGGGFEEDISYAKNFFGTGSDSAVLTVMSNLMIDVPLGPVHPYGVGGFGLIRPHASSNPVGFATSKNAFGYDIGGGITVFVSRHLGLRGDIRRFHSFQGITLLVFSGDSLTFWRASAGLTFK